MTKAPKRTGPSSFNTSLEFKKWGILYPIKNQEELQTESWVHGFNRRKDNILFLLDSHFSLLCLWTLQSILFIQRCAISHRHCIYSTLRVQDLCHTFERIVMAMWLVSHNFAGWRINVLVAREIRSPCNKLAKQRQDIFKKFCFDILSCTNDTGM